jgi:rubrerythrin
MPVHICKTCGTSFPETPAPPAQCPICEGGLNRSKQHFILEREDGVRNGTKIS